MKKFLSLLLFATLVPVTMSAQLANAPRVNVLSKSDAVASTPYKAPQKADLPEGTYLLGNYTTDDVATEDEGLGLTYFFGDTIPTATYVNTTDHIGNKIKSIRVGLANPAKITRVFVYPANENGEMVDSLGVETTCEIDSVRGWSVIDLSEEYTIDNDRLYLGYDYCQEADEYPISCVMQGDEIFPTYCYLYAVEYNYDGWYDVGATSYGNLSIQAIVEGEATGVNGLNTVKQVANTRFFNAAGQQVTNPNGMTIQITTYSDGTRKVEKVIK